MQKHTICANAGASSRFNHRMDENMSTTFDGFVDIGADVGKGEEQGVGKPTVDVDVMVVGHRPRGGRDFGG